MNWDDHAESWDERTDTRDYAQAAFDSLLGLYRQGQQGLVRARVFDFGCGTGLLSEKLAPICREVVALDPSAAMTQVLQTKVDTRPHTNLRVVTSSIETAIEEEEEHVTAPFNLIVCSSVCAFVEDYAETVQTLLALLKPGGRFVQWDWERDPEEEEPFGLTRTQIREVLLSNGMEDVAVDVAFEMQIDGKAAEPLIGHGRKPPSWR